MDDIGQFLFLLAFVIIAAIQWVIKQIQERNAPPESEEDPLEETWRDLEEHQESQRFEGDAPQGRREQEPRPDAANPLGELRQLFESLKQNAAPAETAPPQRRFSEVPVVAATPPPLPVPAQRKEFKDPRARMSGPAERDALKRLEERRKNSLPSKRKRPNDGGFRKFLHDAGNLRHLSSKKFLIARLRSVMNRWTNQSLVKATPDA